MRGVGLNAGWTTPQPSRRCAPVHLLPQGEKEEPSIQRDIRFLDNGRPFVEFRLYVRRQLFRG